MAVFANSGIQALAATIAVVACAVSAGGCSGPHAPPTVPAENVERDRLGLRTIKPHWDLIVVEFDEEKWRCSGHGQGYCKYVHRNPDGTIKWEEDYYYSGHTFTDPDNGVTVSEMLTIHYNYDEGKAYINAVSDNPIVIRTIRGMTSTSHGRTLATDADTFGAANGIMVEMGIVAPNRPWNDAVNVESP